MEELDVSAVLEKARHGEQDAVEQLFPLVYRQLQDTARQELRRWRPGDTMNTTALVHEAYLKLVGKAELELQDRQHFFALAAKAMRQIVVDYARRRQAEKRGRPEDHLPLDEGKAEAQRHQQAEEVLALDQALHRLADRSERLARLVELRYFAGLTFEETAEALELSRRTVHREWRKARAFLFRELGGDLLQDVAQT